MALLKTRSTIFLMVLMVSLTSISSPLSSRFSNWDYGVIYLYDGNSLQGQIRYVPEKALILVAVREKVMSYTADKLNRFSYYDQFLAVHRNFVSIAHGKSHNSKKHIYEVVMSGKLTLLRLQKKSSAFKGYNDAKIRQFVGYSSDFEYYFLYDNRILPLRNFKKQFSELAGDSLPRVNHYINSRKLKYSNVSHQVEMIHFFNHL